MTTTTKNGIVVHEADLESSYAFIAASFPIPTNSTSMDAYPEMYVDAKLMMLPNTPSPFAFVTFAFYDLLKAKLSRSIKLSSPGKKITSTTMIDTDNDIIEQCVKLPFGQGRIVVEGTPYYLRWQFDSKSRVTIAHNYGYITLDELDGIIVDAFNADANSKAAQAKNKITSINQAAVDECIRTKIERDCLPDYSIPTMSVFPTLLKKQ